MTSRVYAAATALLIGVAAIGTALPVLANQSGDGGHGMMQGMMPGGGFGFGRGIDFAAIDADGDGKVTEAELMAHRQSEVAGMDADGDGLISEGELAAHWAARMADVAAEMAAARIAARDADGDGKLSAAEMQMPPMAGRMFSRLDADGDGALSEVEIAAMRDRMAAHGDRGRKGKHNWFGWGADSDN